MKKYLIIALFLISATTFGQTGVGWLPINYNANFKGNTYFTKGGTFAPTSTIVLPTTITLPSGTVMSFDGGDVTLTHSANTLTLAGGALVIPTGGLTLGGASIESTYLPINNGTTTGTLTTAAFRVGGSAATHLDQDSVVLVNGEYTIFNGADTVPPKILASQKTTLATALAGTISKMQFIVDTTAFAPETGDSVFTQSAFIDKHLEIYRGVGGGSLYKQYRNPTGVLQLWHDGYRFQKSTGEIIFKPIFTTNEHIAIEVTDSTLWTDITPQLSLCAEYQAVYDALDIKPSADTALIENAFVVYLKTHGTPNYWSRAALIYVCAQRTAAGAKVNWVNPGTFDLTDPGTTNPTFTKYQGFTGDGSSDYLSTNWDPATNGGTLITLNSATIGYYLRTEVDGHYAMGAYSVGQDRGFRLYARDGGDLGLYINTSTGAWGANATSLGLAMGTRRGVNDYEGYMNGVSKVTGTDASNALITYDLYVLANNNAGTADKFYPAQLPFYIIINGVTDAEVAEINVGVEVLMDAMGIGVE